MTLGRPIRSFVALLCLASVLSVGLPRTACGQEPAKLTWDNVLRLRAGDQILVATDKGAYNGKVDSVDAEALLLTTDQKQGLFLRRDSVKMVRDHGKHRKLGWGIITASLLVVSSGILIDAVRDTSSLSSGSMPKKHGLTTFYIGAAMIPAGALVLWKGGSRVIYERPKPPEPANPD